MGSSPYGGNAIFAKELEAELMKFTKKDEDYNVDTALNKQTGEVQRNTDVNITECMKTSGNELFEGRYLDTTESSSSFGDSNCGIENVGSAALSDFCDDADSMFKLGGFDERKRPTAHWRSFIQPLMWRCKWTELQIKNLQFLAQRYDQELEAQNNQKLTNLGNSALDSGVKSLPFSHNNPKSDVMKRKQRRKTEVTTDVAAYMSSHNLFSYYENKKSFSERVVISNLPKNPVTHKTSTDDGFYSNDDELSIETIPGDDSFEHLLWKIYNLQSQVCKLKDRVDRVMTENADRLSCVDILNLPTSRSASTSNSEDRMPVGTYIASQLISEYHIGDARLTDNAVTSHGDISDANGGMAYACFANAYDNVEDGVLIENRMVKEELNGFKEMMIPPFERPVVFANILGNVAREDVRNSKEVKIHPIQIPSALKDGSSNTNSNSSIPTEPEVAMLIDEQPAPKIRSLAKLTAPKAKKKRRKGAGQWSRRPKG